MRTRSALTAVAAAAVTAFAGLAAPAAPALAQSAPASEQAQQQILVKIAPGVDARDLANRVGGAVTNTLDPLGVVVISVPAHQAAAAQADLSGQPGVVYAEQDAVASVAGTPTDPLYRAQSGPRKINSEPVWLDTRGTADTVIAVIDTGVNDSAGDLDGILNGIDIANRDSDPADDHGHGSATAHVLAATWNNGVRTAGMCDQCAILPVKVFGPTGSGPVSNVTEGVIYAADQGADVINLSLTTPVNVASLRGAIEYAHSKGALVIAAAGNRDISRPHYPAAYPTVIGVGATDLDDTKTVYSNFGDWVDVSAPGSNPTTIHDGRLVNFQGTSSAAPLVAGTAALLRTGRPDATSEEIASAIRSTAVPFGDAVAHGRVDAYKALLALPVTVTGTLGRGTAQAHPVTGPETNRSEHTFTYHSPVRASSVLTFTDAKRLTLTITDPNGVQVVKVNVESGDEITADLPAGTSTWTVSGSTKATYRLTTKAG